MLTKKKTGSAEWTDPDDAPRLTPEMRAKAEEFEGDRFVRRAGRPRLDSPKEQINIRLDAPVLRHFRKSGPGWQTRAAQALRDVVLRGLQEQKVDLDGMIASIEAGNRVHRNGRDSDEYTAEVLAQHRETLAETEQAIAELDALR